MAQRSRWALPAVVNPPDSLCCLVNVPNDQNHIAAFLGAIYELTRPYSWQNDTAHTAIQAGAVWQPIFDALRLELCSDFVCPVTIDEWEDFMSVCESLRFNPATGLFEGFCCGSWSAISGQPVGGLFGSGSAVGQPLPAAGGGCQTYTVRMSASDQQIVAPVVNTGDVITVSAITGNWTDGSGTWFTPSGNIFFAGIAGAPSGANGADPVITGPHMGLLVKIAGVFHYIGDGAAYTVPGGVTNALVIFQANDASLTDDSGQIAFNVQICNNQAAAWSHKFDFKTSPHGWTINTIGVWTAGVGFTNTDANLGFAWARGVSLALSGLPAFHCTALQLEYGVTLGPVVTPANQSTLIACSGGVGAFNAQLAFTAMVNGADQFLAAFGSDVGATALQAACQASQQVAAGTLAGSSKIISVTVSGDGPQPTWL